MLMGAANLSDFSYLVLPLLEGVPCVYKSTFNKSKTPIKA